MARPPAKFVARAGGVGNKNWWVARPAGADLDRKLAAGDLTDSGDEFAYRPAAAGAEIEGGTFRTIEQGMERLHVSIGEITHMNVIAHTGAVCGRIIITKNGEGFAFPDGRLEQERDRVRFRNVTFADFTVRIRACSVELAQRDVRQRESRGAFPQHLFTNLFSGAVRINRHIGGGFRDRNDGGCAIDRAAR